MFRHILVPVDGSPATWQAIDKAVAIAIAFQSPVTVISVIDPDMLGRAVSGLSLRPPEPPGSATQEANAAINSARHAFESRGIVVKGSVVESASVYQAILDAAETLDADLVVMSSHGRRGLEKMVLGSVTAQVLAHAHLPVLVVRD